MVNLDVGGYTKNPTSPENTQKNAKKQRPTENQKNTKPET